MTVEVTDDDNFHQVFEEHKSKPIILFFTAKWCGPCQMLKPTLEEEAEKYKDRVTAIKIDVDVCEDIASEYNVSSMPTFMIVIDGQVKETFSGGNKGKLVEFFEKAAL